MITNRFTITRDDDGIRLQKWLKKTFPQVPLSAIHRNLRTKQVKYNGKRAKGDELLQEGDEVRIFFQPGTTADSSSQKTPAPSQKLLAEKFTVIFEDDDLVAVNKPAGIAVHPGSGTAIGKSMIDLAVAKYPEENIRLAHRLDKDTSGVLLFARNGSALRKVLKSLRDKQFEKKYITLVAGRLQDETGTIRLSISREYSGPRVDREGKKSVTHFAVKKRFSDCTLVEIELETGRMHQIRTHFAAIGHPVLGDDKHGDFEKNREFKKQYNLRRQFLHAANLTFPHPETGKMVNIQAELPEDLQAVLNQQKNKKN